MRPFTPWHLEINVNKNFEGYNGVSFEKAVNAFEIYNCTDNETGRYTAFYIPVVTVDRFTGKRPRRTRWERSNNMIIALWRVEK